MCTEEIFQLCCIFTVFTFCMVLIGYMGYEMITDEYELHTSKTCIEYSPRNGECVKNKVLYSCELDGDALFASEDLDKVNEYCETKRKGNK